MLKDYESYINKIENICNEHALNKKQISNIENLHKIGFFKKIIEEISVNVENLIKELKKIKKEEILLDIREENNKFLIRVEYKPEIEYKLSVLKLTFDKINYDEKIISKIFPDSQIDFNLDIDITTKNFNQIDIMNSLPLPFKGIGLGKKILECIINHFSFVSLQNHTKPSNEITMLFLSLSKDKNYYTFVNERQDILVCKKDISILDTVKNFLKDSDYFEIDYDFLNDFNLVKGDFL